MSLSSSGQGVPAKGPIISVIFRIKDVEVLLEVSLKGLGHEMNFTFGDKYI